MNDVPSFKPRNNGRMAPGDPLNGRIAIAPPPAVVAQLVVQMNSDGKVATNFNGPGRDCLNIMIARAQQDLIPAMIAAEKAAAEKTIEIAPANLVIDPTL